MRIGPLEISWNSEKKTWNQLAAIINSEKGGANAIALRTNPKEQMTQYKSWIYSCVSLISDRIASLPYGFYNIDTDEELSTKNKGYKIFTKPFKHPNDLMTYRFIKNFCQIQLDLCGMACIYKAYNKLGQVWELWPLNMNDFINVEVSGGVISPSVKYIFKSGNEGKWIDFDNNELIVINYPHPTAIYVGMSPIQAQAYASDIDTYVEVYERDFFKNSARIDFALTTEVQLDQEKANELKERWLEKYKGRFHDVAVLDSGLKPVPLKYTNRDFEFLNLAQWSKDKILACYRIPSSKLGSVDTNRAGSVYSDISFNRESIHPRLVLWDEEMTEGVCSTYDSRLSIKHQNPIPRDRQIELQEAKAYCGVPTLTINEYRERIHRLPAISGGDRVIIPQNYIYLEDLEKVTQNNIANSKPNDSDRDRSDEEPHVNPDGTDDRDDNPTDGRALIPQETKQVKSLKEFHSLIFKSRKLWNEMIFNSLKNVNIDNFEKQLNIVLVECIMATIDVLFDYYDSKTFSVDTNDWIINIAEKTSSEYTKTLLKNPKYKEIDWSVYFEDQFNSNPRLSKIVNALLKSSINYAKWLMLTNKKSEIEWVVNSNECGHKGRIKEMTTYDNFEIGVTKIRFPGEILSFGCDCTISDKQ